MTQKLNSFERFLKELKRRKVVHVITVYAATAFVILELVNMVARPLKLPDWTEALVIVLLCIGFVITILLSWIYDITPAGVKKTKPISAIKHSDQLPASTSGGWKIATYVSGAIIVALVTFNFISRRNINADILKLEKSIAVLPFINDSPDTTNAYFINGIMERITTNLQMLKELRVISRNSVEKYRNNKTKSSSEIAEDLGVNYIIEGSGQKVGNSISVTTQLIKAKGKETHLWAKTYDQKINEVNDYFRIQSEIAEKIAEELKTAIAPVEKQLIEKIPTKSLTADDFYRKGIEELGGYSSLFPSSRISLERASKMFKNAVDQDSLFAQAYVGLAQVYRFKHYWDTYLTVNFLDSALYLVNKALSIDNELPEAYTVRGSLYREKGLADKAIEEYDKALKYNPNDYLAYSEKGYINHFVLNDFVKAIDNLNNAAIRHRGNELGMLLYNLGRAYLDIGFIEKANQYYRECLKLDVDSTNYFGAMAWLEFSQANFVKASKLFDKFVQDTSLSLFGDPYFTFAGQHEKAYNYYLRYIEQNKKTGKIPTTNTHRIGYAFWKMGKYKEADYYFNEQIRYSLESIKLGRQIATGKQSHYNLAATYSFLGYNEKGNEYLEEINKKESFPLWWVTLIKYDPLFDNMRGDKLFQKTVKNIEAKYQAEHERVREKLGEQGML